MSWSASAFSASFWEDLMDGTTTIDLDTDAFKTAVYDNSITPSKTAGAPNYGYGLGIWAAGEESDGTDWDAGGEPLPSPTVTKSAGVIVWSGGNVVSGGTQATISAYGCMTYSDTATSPVVDQGICHNYFGGLIATANGVYTVQWDSSDGLGKITAV